MPAVAFGGFVGVVVTLGGIVSFCSLLDLLSEGVLAEHRASVGGLAVFSISVEASFHHGEFVGQGGGDILVSNGVDHRNFITIGAFGGLICGGLFVVLFVN
jgi:hypothetical protein